MQAVYALSIWRLSVQEVIRSCLQRHTPKFIKEEDNMLLIFNIRSDVDATKLPPDLQCFPRKFLGNTMKANHDAISQLNSIGGMPTMCHISPYRSLRQVRSTCDDCGVPTSVITLSWESPINTICETTKKTLLNGSFLPKRQFACFPIAIWTGGFLLNSALISRFSDKADERLCWCNTKIVLNKHCLLSFKYSLLTMQDWANLTGLLLVRFKLSRTNVIL